MADEWKTVVRHQIRQTESRDKAGSGWGVWVVQKFKNKKHASIKLVAGSYYTHQVSGEIVYPKDGLSLKDFEAISPVYKDKIQPLLAAPPPYPDEPEAESDDINEVPF